MPGPGFNLRAFKEAVDEQMSQLPDLRSFCDRCLRTERWRGSVVLMVVDASFTSIGMSYLRAVVPSVLNFERRFVRSGVIASLRDLTEVPTRALKAVWKNERSWAIAKGIAETLTGLSSDDRSALRGWAERSSLSGMRDDPIGRLKGVGPVTFQYLRMMGGVDTVMPDKVVKKVLNEFIIKSGGVAPKGNVEFVETIEWLARECGYRPVELCWMTWLLTSDREVRVNYDTAILERI
ncbi:MAG: hypothetical protein NZ920_03590 [Aigarchaeota archaeon]|nr:hypothetical protein [Aigarchaeota archaeon]MDW8092297.1 hypothetical protein [Nitrososphaerota archaeon]